MEPGSKSHDEPTSAHTPASAKPRALYFISSMEAGGAERVLLTYLDHSRRFQPILLLEQLGGEFMGEIPPNLPVLSLSHAPIVDSLFPSQSPWSASLKKLLGVAARMSPLLLKHAVVVIHQAKKLASLAQQQGCMVVSSFLFEANIVALMAKCWFDPHLRVVLNAHDMASEFHRHRFLVKLVIRRFYPRADCIVAASHGIKRDLADNFGIEAAKICVVHNPCDAAFVQHQSRHALDLPVLNAPHGPMIVAVGRLVKLKGYDLLIRAFARLISVQNATLVIIGDGDAIRGSI